jgi:radical SAM protein with 4Fe4S-binding SPASM domain
MHTEQKIRNDIIDRVPLSNVIPLDTPFRLGIDVANGCNFKCAFCFHSICAHDLKEMGFKSALMKMDTFEKLLEQIKDFPDKFKSITFGGIGEPLLHEELPKMIQMLKGINKSDKISVVTNGYLLTNEFSKALVAAGLDEIIISVEALSSEKYYEVTKFKVDFEKYINNIRYLYENRKQCKIYNKIVDVSFDDENDESKFHDMFDEISDLAFVEAIVPRYKHVDYTNMNYTDDNLSLRHKSKADICSISFFSLSIFPSGNVGPCCVDYCETIVLGNINESSLLNMWRGDKLKNLRLAHLKKVCSIPICKGCKFTQHNGRVEDIIDEDAEQLICRIKKEMA